MTTVDDEPTRKSWLLSTIDRMARNQVRRRVPASLEKFANFVATCSLTRFVSIDGCIRPTQ